MHIPSQKYLYFVGIGGVGMSGIAELLHNLGYLVQGSSNVENDYTKRLRSLGIPVHIGHDSMHILGAQVVVASSAISEDNPEIKMAKSCHIPVIQRAEMLAELMRLKQSVAVSGSHGKTTTTSLAGALLQEGGADPTIVNGGIINAYKANVRLGQGDWIVVEADESDGSFNKLSPTIAILTNIDLEHMDYYEDLSQLKRSFEDFIANIPFYGLAILCADHPIVMSLKIPNRRIMTYGLSEASNIRGVNVRLTPEGAYFDVMICVNQFFDQKVIPLPLKIKDLFIPMVGSHNVLNSLSIVALAVEMGFEEKILRNALQTFQGVKRRFTRTGIVHDITIIDDYAHHPVEIRATIEAARQITKGRILVVAQPHRYTRLQSLFHDFVTCFEHADALFLLPVYGANEDPIPGIDSITLAHHIGGHATLVSQETLCENLIAIAEPGDTILCLGAGNITSIAHDLPQQLESLYQRPKHYYVSPV